MKMEKKPIGSRALTNFWRFPPAPVLPLPVGSGAAAEDVAAAEVLAPLSAVEDAVTTGVDSTAPEVSTSVGLADSEAPPLVVSVALAISETVALGISEAVSLAT
jgi:hypothetical protein